MSSSLHASPLEQLFGEYTARATPADTHAPVLAGAEAVSVLLDLLGHRAAVFRSQVAFGSRTRSLDQLLAAEPQGAVLLGAIRDFASQSVPARTGPHCDDVSRRTPGGVLRTEVRAGTTSYTLLRVDLQIGSQPLVVVVVEHADVQASVAAVLRQRYGLTDRELEVVHELAAGRSVRGVGEQLGMSEHTARHHTERVYRKVGVHTRAALGERLRSIEAMFRPKIAIG